MGCDIHAFIERKEKESKHWSGFGGQIRLDRNYGMFGVMAGVRESVEPVVQPRGLPEDMGYAAAGDAYLRINDDYAEDEGYTSLAKAKEWEGRGEKIIYDNDGEPEKVTHPDWHTHSWLSTNEFGRVLEAYESKYGNDDHPSWAAEYKAAYAAMREFENLGLEARLIFWFDN